MSRLVLDCVLLSLCWTTGCADGRVRSALPLDRASLAMEAPLPEQMAETANYLVGTQTFDPRYHFTQESPILETARAILEMGSSTIKTWDKYEDDLPAILAMPFRNYFLWVRSHGDNRTPWLDGLSADERACEYRAVYDFARRLLIDHAGSGKAFYLGHWEGDWQLLDGYDPKIVPSPTAIQGMIDWLDVRQQAVDDAKRDTPHQNVAVYHFTEVNRVRDAMISGLKRVVNEVLPRTRVDFVSYSAYDSQQLTQQEVNRTLDYIVSKLPPKKGLPDQRVFVGEMGWPAKFASYKPAEHDQKNREFILKFLRWGAPFVLYWEMYNNEFKDGQEVGYWLINDKNEKQPLFFSLQNLYQRAKAHVADFYRANGQLPTDEEIRKLTVELLSDKK